MDILGAQKSTWAQFLEFDYFYLKREVYIDIARAKINLGSHISIHKSYNEIVDKIVFMSAKTGQK